MMIPESTESAGEADSGFAAIGLVGTWVGPCFPESPQGTEQSAHFDVTETTWALDYSAYGDDARSAAFLTVDIAGDCYIEGVIRGRGIPRGYRHCTADSHSSR